MLKLESIYNAPNPANLVSLQSHLMSLHATNCKSIEDYVHQMAGLMNEINSHANYQFFKTATKPLKRIRFRDQTHI